MSAVQPGYEAVSPTTSPFELHPTEKIHISFGSELNTPNFRRKGSEKENRNKEIALKE